MIVLILRILWFISKSKPLIFFLFLHPVARVRRRSDHPLSGIVVYLENIRRQEILVFYQGKIKWESPPNFWLLGTLIGLRDQVWRLVA
jgi:hypothetical protein